MVVQRAFQIRPLDQSRQRASFRQGEFVRGLPQLRRDVVQAEFFIDFFFAVAPHQQLGITCFDF